VCFSFEGSVWSVEVVEVLPLIEFGFQIDVAGQPRWAQLCGPRKKKSQLTSIGLDSAFQYVDYLSIIR
jgi:hypothetical protein